MSGFSRTRVKRNTTIKHRNKGNLNCIHPLYRCTVLMDPCFSMVLEKKKKKKKKRKTLNIETIQHSSVAYRNSEST